MRCEQWVSFHYFRAYSTLNRRLDFRLCAGGDAVSNRSTAVVNNSQPGFTDSFLNILILFVLRLKAYSWSDLGKVVKQYVEA